MDPSQVATVVLSHLHTDHVGWAVVGEPYFANATYLLQRAEHAIDDSTPRYVRRCSSRSRRPSSCGSSTGT
jgi:glyoxylase-like metal-dependent hydrolase (beta-lactamase superfamily II)